VIVLAHAGHVLVDMLYALPLVVMVGFLVVGKLRERRGREKPTHLEET
jgi:hypothetical protein